ncbi:MAG: hypothetical protein A2X35_05960 [Elusimicrobia bacterium GWA2_61_42]|nr:MAG: hypothetical protein A2X35_05960 [Elusimicrobia bacterium GWA2_61_42]OGR80310.1 MAG: hypothetical protein A2X38_00985 [Elusimicrobia bacterium GWC2_61_25]
MIKCYAKLFGLLSFFFFLGTLAANLNMFEGTDSILEGLLSSLFFGAVTAAVIGTMHINRVRALAGGRREGDIYAASQTAEVRLPVDPIRAFHLVSHYFREVARFEVTGSDQIGGRISARTPLVLFKTLGNTVTAELRAQEGGTLVILSSSPVLTSGIPDYGTTLKIIMDAENFLKAGARR